MTLTPLESICTRISSGGTPSRKNPGYFSTTDSGHLWVKSKELLDCAIEDTEEHITDDGLNNSSAKYYPAHTVLVAMYGANVGQLGWLRKPATVNQAICGLVIDEKEADWRYIFYYLLLNRGDLTIQAQGAAQQNLNQDMVRKFSINLPPLPIQRRFAAILSTYDDLIENSQRRIKILESMACILYREWFVYFRFPGHEDLPCVPSSLGDIPERWEVKQLGGIVKLVTKGTTPTTLKRQFKTEGFNFIKAEAIEESGALIEEKFAKIDSETHELLKRSQLCANDILFSIAGVIGRACIVPNRILPANTNQALAIIRCESPFLIPYLYMTLRDEYFKNYSFGRIVQTAQANVSLTDLRTAPIVMPPFKLLSEFNAFAKPLMAHVQVLSEQIQNLRRTRDLLLPRLLSGQIKLAA